ncbi:MAG: dicarboxylate/amino acid:cation symporter [Desulfobacterales bacterium]|nr:dicarboxylate/amino acid:cation symporter [Desulfobacterales bacterium]MCP4158697.1 dicarboxylate/amino acid:cation symporter [Deltaproteobacteria bacterium]
MNDTKKSKFHFNQEWLLSPWAIFISMAIGILIGAYQKDLAGTIAPFGKIYLSLLQMCILPVLLCAVASSLGKLVKSNEAKGSIKKMVIIFSIGLFAASVLGILAGIIGQPGNGLNEETQAVLGRLVQKTGSNLNLEMFFFQENPMAKGAPSLVDFFVKIIPPNVVESMSSGRNLQVLFFAVMLGVAAGFIPQRESDNLLMSLEGTYLAFSKVIKWAMYILPFGLCCLMAEQVSQIGVEILMAMTKFVATFILCALFIFLLCTLIIWRRSKRKISEVIIELKEPIIIALGTRSSLATIPSCLEALHTKLGFDKTNTNILVPLGVTLCRFGSIVYFALATIFITQLYDVQLGTQGYIIALIGSILAGMATSGATGVLTLSMMILVLEPLGLPFEAVLVLFIAIDPIIDPFRTLLIVYAACASSALISGREKYINLDRIYFESGDCYFATDRADLKVLNVNSFGIACESDIELESNETIEKGTLKYKDFTIGDYNFKVVRVEKGLNNNSFELGLEIIDSLINVEDIVSLKSKFAKT